MLASFPAQGSPAAGEYSTDLERILLLQDSLQITRHGSHLTFQRFNKHPRTSGPLRACYR